MSKENSFLNPLGDSLGSLVHSFMDLTTDLAIKGTCKILGTETNYIREKRSEEELFKLKKQKEREELQQQLEDRKKEYIIDKKNNVIIDGEEYNFCDLWFNVGLTNKSKDMPVLKKCEVKEVCNVFTFDCPVGITKSKIEEKIEEIAAFFDTYEGNIEIRKHKNYIDIIVITCNIFEKLYKYKQDILSKNEGLKFPVGYFLSNDHSVKLLSVDMAKKGNHAALIAGASGSGKSSLLRLILLHLVLNYTPDQLKIVIIAGSGDTDFMFLKDTSPHLHNNKIYMDIDEIIGNEANESKKIPERIGILDEIRAEIEVRTKRFSEVGANNIDEYYQLGYTDIPYKLVVFDEYAFFSSTKKFDDLQKVMGTISQTARKTGIKVITCLQDSQNKFYNPAIKYNTPLKFCFAAENESHSKNMCNYTGLEDIKNIGEGRLFSTFNMPEGKDYISFKALLPPDETKALKNMIKKKYPQNKH